MRERDIHALALKVRWCARSLFAKTDSPGRGPGRCGRRHRRGLGSRSLAHCSSVRWALAGLASRSCSCSPSPVESRSSSGSTGRYGIDPSTSYRARPTFYPTSRDTFSTVRTAAGTAASLSLPVPRTAKACCNSTVRPAALSLPGQTPRSPPSESRSSAPLLLMDVDGVLNPYPDCPDGFIEYVLFPDDDEPVRLAKERRR